VPLQYKGAPREDQDVRGTGNLCQHAKGVLQWAYSYGSRERLRGFSPRKAVKRKVSPRGDP